MTVSQTVKGFLRDHDAHARARTHGFDYGKTNRLIKGETTYEIHFTHACYITYFRSLLLYRHKPYYRHLPSRQRHDWR